jgi:hypothetical protein
MLFWRHSKSEWPENLHAFPPKTKNNQQKLATLKAFKLRYYPELTTEG